MVAYFLYRNEKAKGETVLEALNKVYLMEKNHLDRGKRKTYFSKEIEYMRQNQEKKKKKK